MRSPICWFGGKGHMAARISPLFPEHRIYVEPFGGGGSLLFYKEPSEIEVYNDLDSGLVNLFRVLRDPEKFGKLYHYISLTPYSREEYLQCRELLDESSDEIVQAYRWYVVARSSFGGIFGSSWGYTVSSSGQGMASSCSRWMTAFHMLPAIHERL
ncbi:MAG: DNA adenine methylase, partial [Armatimonadota bacterium]